MISFYLFLGGLILGSFLNTCIHRLPRGESIVAPASHCPNCGQRLGWLDLIPLAGFFLLRGRCRYCHKAISWRYPLVELVLGLLLVFFYFFLDSGMFLTATVVAALLVVVTCTDLEQGLIPDAIVLPALGTGILFSLVSPSITLANSLAGALLGGGVLVAVALLSRGGMGGGDIKLLAALGAWLGPRQVLLILFLSFFLGGIGALGLLLLKIKARRDAIAFAPYIAAAVFITLFWGEMLYDWYFRLWG